MILCRKHSEALYLWMDKYFSPPRSLSCHVIHGFSSPDLGQFKCGRLYYRSFEDFFFFSKTNAAFTMILNYCRLIISCIRSNISLGRSAWFWVITILSMGFRTDNLAFFHRVASQSNLPSIPFLFDYQHFFPFQSVMHITVMLTIPVFTVPEFLNFLVFLIRS